jgi:hypothetical protein
VSAVGRLDATSGRWYVDPADPSVAYESVTTILSGSEDKPWLAPWAAKLTAEYAVDNLGDVTAVASSLGRDAAVRLLKDVAAVLRDLKADVGSYVHDVIEALILGAEIPDLPAHLRGVDVDGEPLDVAPIVDGFLAFRADHGPVFHLAEATVANPIHGYAGTLDLVAYLPAMRRLLLIDSKTGKTLDHGMKAQLAAYRRATEVWIDRLGNKAPMPQVDGAAILHLRPEHRRGYRLLEVDAGDAQFAEFLAAQRLLTARRARAKAMGRPLYVPLPDGSQPPIRVEDIDLDGFARARAALVKAGVQDIAGLAAMTPEDCRAIKGIGPATLTACEVALDAYGYRFAGDDMREVA